MLCFCTLQLFCDDGPNRAGAMTKLLVLLFFMALGVSEAGAAQCEISQGSNQKPVLNGRVQDGANGIGFLWWSKTRGNWQIENGICNSGKLNLIVSWPKTLLFTSAYRPLPP